MEIVRRIRMMAARPLRYVFWPKNGKSGKDLAVRTDKPATSLTSSAGADSNKEPFNSKTVLAAMEQDALQLVIALQDAL